MKKGIFITFEGAEGSGKSTHIRGAANYFRKCGRSVLLIREPGSTAISELIRGILLDKKNKAMVKETELLLYLAARAQLVKEKIVPALKAGKVVISDRFEDSTVAYQGYGAGVSIPLIECFSNYVRGSLKPDLTFVLDVDPQVGFRRGGRHDRVEKKSSAFHARVRRGFLTLVRKNSKRMFLVSTMQPLPKVRQLIFGKLHEIFG